MPSKEFTQWHIDNTDNIMKNIIRIFKLFAVEIWKNIYDLFEVFLKNIYWWGWTRTIATIVVVSFTVIPLFKSYFSFFELSYSRINAFFNHNEIVYELSQSYEKSVQDFFKTYNKKYWLDCDRVRSVNVDFNMAHIWWTETKPWKWCIEETTIKMFPISIDDLRSDKTKWIARVSWKAVFIWYDRDLKLEKVCLLRYNLWKKLTMPQWFWKFDPFEDHECYPNDDA